MGVGKPQRPVTRAMFSAAQTKQEPAVSRNFDAVEAKFTSLDARISDRDVQTVSLVLGLNKITHGLGRAVTGYNITPSVADASFAHALVTTGNNAPDRQVWITVIGVAQPAAVIEVY